MGVTEKGCESMKRTVVRWLACVVTVMNVCIH